MPGPLRTATIILSFFSKEAAQGLSDQVEVGAVLGERHDMLPLSCCKLCSFQQPVSPHLVLEEAFSRGKSSSIHR